jgi:hypothetical protein
MEAYKNGNDPGVNMKGKIYLKDGSKDEGDILILLDGSISVTNIIFDEEHLKKKDKPRVRYSPHFWEKIEWL